MNKQSRPLLPVLVVAFIAILSTFEARGQGPVLTKPKVYKNPVVIPMANLGITDLFEGNTPTSVYIQIGNVGSANAGPFFVKLSLKKKGSTTKTYVEKLVGGVKAKTDLPLFIEVGQPIAGLEIGVFIDSRNQIREPDETNCGKMFPDGGMGGYMPCKDF
jgi:hypothetical protein